MIISNKGSGTSALDKNKHGLDIFIDLKKAFRTCNRQWNFEKMSVWKEELQMNASIVNFIKGNNMFYMIMLSIIINTLYVVYIRDQS